MPKRNQFRLTKRGIESANPNTFLWDSEVPGFGVRVHPSGTRSFVFQFRSRAGVQGKITVGTFPILTVEEARKIARDLRVEVEKGGNPSRARKQVRQAATVRDLADHYYNEYAKQRGLKPRTVADARRVIDNYAMPLIGSLKVSDVTAADVRAAVGKARGGSGRYQANRLRAALSKIFALAIQQDLRSDNPCKGVERYAEDQRWQHLGDSEVGRLLRACDAHPDQNAASAVRLLLFTGARLQEVVKASWDQFDLDRGVWEKPSHHTKTKLRHRLRLSTEAISLLRDMRERDPQSAFLFPGKNSDKPRSDLNRPWSVIRKNSGLAGYRIHDLRRTTASFMLSEGADLSAVGKTLGHTQASTTARYAHLFEEVQQQGVSRATARMMSCAGSG